MYSTYTIEHVATAHLAEQRAAASARRTARELRALNRVQRANGQDSAATAPTRIGRRRWFETFVPAH